MEWVFDGIGSTLVGTALGLLLGASGGVYFTRHHYRQQIVQRAGANSRQTAAGRDVRGSDSE